MAKAGSSFLDPPKPYDSAQFDFGTNITKELNKHTRLNTLGIETHGSSMFIRERQWYNIKTEICGCLSVNALKNFFALPIIELLT